MTSDYEGIDCLGFSSLTNPWKTNQCFHLEETFHPEGKFGFEKTKKERNAVWEEILGF